MSALLQLDPEIANDVIERENEANNIFWLIRRLLYISLKSRKFSNGIIENGTFDLTDIRAISRNLENIADCSVNIAKTALDFHRITHDSIVRASFDEKGLEEMPHLTQLIEDMFKKTMESLFKRDIAAANDAINMRKKISDTVEEVMNVTTTPYYRAITGAVATIAENCANIASVALDLELNRSNFFPKADSNKA